MLPDIAKEFEIANALHPVAIVDDMHPLACALQNGANLPLHTGDVVGQRFW